MNNYIDEILTKIKKTKNEAVKGKFTPTEADDSFIERSSDDVEENLERIKVLKDDDIMRTLESAVKQNLIMRTTQQTLMQHKQK